MSITVKEYQDRFFNNLDYIKNNIIRPATGDSSEIRTRYVTSEGNNDEQWIGFMRDEQNQNVDIWLMTITRLRGLTMEEKSPGTTDKPISIAVDYFYDYHYGVDAAFDTSGKEVATNTEREFLKRVLALDLLLEQRQGCLGSGIYIESWDLNIRLKRFKSATTHWLQGVINLKFTEISL